MGGGRGAGAFCHGQITWENGPSLLVHPSGKGVGGVHRISGTGGRISGTGGRGPQLGYGGRVHDIHMLPW